MLRTFCPTGVSNVDVQNVDVLAIAWIVSLLRVTLRIQLLTEVCLCSATMTDQATQQLSTAGSLFGVLPGIWLVSTMYRHRTLQPVEAHKHLASPA
jgi:hypothetical protein